MINSMTRNSLTLAGFALASALVVVITHEVTADQIELQRQKQLLSAISEITPEQLSLEQLQQQCHQIENADFLGDAQPKRLWITDTGTSVYETIAPEGYNGAIHLLVAVAADNTISGVRVTSHNETPGLGDQIELRKSDWVLNFDGKKLPDNSVQFEYDAVSYATSHSFREEPSWAVKKDGGQFDAFTGATITPRAVVKAVFKVLQLHQTGRNQILRDEHSCSL